MKKLFLALVLLFTAMMPSVSQAKNGDLSGALLVGNGFKDGVNIGIGARGVYEIQNNITLGASFTYNLGKSQGGVDITSWFLAAEGGYNIPLQGSNVSVRPYVGVGIAGVSASYDYYGYSGSTSDTKFYLRPGVTVTVPVGGNFFVGGDACFHVVQDINAFGIYATVGTNF
ncbi:MAG: porin family protein [Chlorobiales bacterium]|jgi:hypothetical protein|nr:porin family protein [Chlorobiales bacterium]